MSSEARKWLRERGAESIDHAAGTLAEHLERVHDRLAGLGLSEDLQLAGLTHAAYGTDGFALSLLPVDRRHVLRELVGERAEAIVYRYGGCDRGHTWRALAATGLVRSRFTGAVEAPSPDELRDFADLSIVNELDVLERDAEIAAQHGDYLLSLFESWAGLASPAVLADVRAYQSPARRARQARPSGS